MLHLRIREARKAKKLTQAALAEIAGVRRATVASIENRRTKGVDFQTLEALAKALDVHPSWLVVQTRK